MIILFTLYFINLLWKWPAHVTWHIMVVMKPQFFLFSYMFGWIYHEILKVSDFFLPLYFHVLTEAHIHFLKIGTGSVPVWLFPWLQTFHSGSTHEQHSMRVFSAAAQLALLSGYLIQISAAITDIKYLLLFLCELDLLILYRVMFIFRQ
jgi:hypothetical protein